MTADEIERAVSDPQHFAERYCKSVRGTSGGPVLATIPAHPYLAPFWDAFRNQDDLLIEKTRQMTVSWTVCSGLLHDVLFRPNWADLILSRMEKLVDDGGENSTFESLMGKIRFMHSHLPEEIRLPLEFSHLKIRNPESGASITGSATSPQAGRSGHFSRVLMDEAAFVPRSEQVYGAFRQGCPRGKIIVSTPNGKGNVFYRLRSSDAGYKVLRMHWSDHPERRCDCDGEHRGCWYAAQCEDMSPLQVARELDISYEESVAGKVWYGWGDAFVGDVPYIPGQTVVRGWDFGVGDQTAIIFAQVVNLHSATGKLRPQIRIFDAYRNSGQGARHYRDVCQEKAKAYTAKVRDVGDPHNLTSRDSDLRSWHTNLSDNTHPYRVNVKPSGCQGTPYEDVIDNARRFMSVIECQDGEHRPRLLVDSKLRALIGCFEGWRYRTDDEGRIVGEKPIHDEMSHWMDAFKYLAWDVSPANAMPGTISSADLIAAERVEVPAPW